MSDAEVNTEPPKKPDRMAQVGAVLVRRAVVIGVVAGGLLGLGLGAVVLNVIGCRRDAARVRENQKMLDDWNVEQKRKD